MARYEGDWRSYTDILASVSDDYQLPPEQDIIYACYDNGGYDGSALIVFQKDGKLFENHDSHCSCYGLEKWEPEECVAIAAENYQNWPGLAEALREWKG